MAPRLGYIGLGNMGRGMCKNLVEKGNLTSPLTIWNRTPSRAESLAASIGNCTVAPSIADVVSNSDIIFTCLINDAAVVSTITTAVSNGDIKGKTLVDCSTVHPDTTDGMTKIVEGHGGSFVACPVFGPPASAEAGTLILVLAGKGEDIDKVIPYCKGVTGRANIVYRDDPTRKASLMKVLGNTFVFGMIEQLSQGHVLAEKTGLGCEALQEWVDLFYPGPYGAYSRRMTTGDYWKREEPLFAAEGASKDCKHALSLAAQSGAKARGVEVALSHLEMLREAAGERADLAGIYGAVRLESGLPFKNN